MVSRVLTAMLTVYLLGNSFTFSHWGETVTEAINVAWEEH